MPSVTPPDVRSPRSWVLLVVFLVMVIGIGGLIGSQSAPGGWYQNLAKPPFNPPNWVFAPAWLILYILIAIAGWRIFSLDRNGLAMKLWYGQILLNWLWTPTWFVLHLIWPAFVVILALWLLIIAFIVVARRRDALSAWLFVPYLLWVSFAGLLNLSIGILN